MGPLVSIVEIVIEVAELAAEAAAAAAEAAVEAGVEAAVEASVDAVADASIDSALDAAIDNVGGQLARSAGGQAMKRLTDKVGGKLARATVKKVKEMAKDKAKEKAKDEAHQYMKDVMNGKQPPPDLPKDVPTPTAPPGVDLANPAKEQYVQVENYFKEMHGAISSSRGNNNSLEMFQLGGPTNAALVGMVKIRTAEAAYFKKIEFNADLATKDWQTAEPKYQTLAIAMKEGDEKAGDDNNFKVWDDALPDIQNTINDALANTYVMPPLPGLTTNTVLPPDPYDDPKVYYDAQHGIEARLKDLNGQFRNAFNFLNKQYMIEYSNQIVTLCNIVVPWLQTPKIQQDMRLRQVDANNALQSWYQYGEKYKPIQKSLTMESTRDDVEKLCHQAIDDAQKIIMTLLAQTAQSSPEEQAQAEQNAIDAAKASVGMTSTMNAGGYAAGGTVAGAPAGSVQSTTAGQPGAATAGQSGPAAGQTGAQSGNPTINAPYSNQQADPTANAPYSNQQADPTASAQFSSQQADPTATAQSGAQLSNQTDPTSGQNVSSQGSASQMKQAAASSSTPSNPSPSLIAQAATYAGKAAATHIASNAAGYTGAAFTAVAAYGGKRIFGGTAK